MEDPESAINRFGRAIWTVWGYLRGTVGRYLRPEVTNEEAHNLHFKQEDTEAISKSSIELKEKKEEKERTETKSNETRDDLQCPGIRVRAAAVHWESIAHGGHEVKDKSKHICHSSEDKNKKSQTKEDNEQTLENQEKSSDVGIKNRDSTLSGSEEADQNVERHEQEQTKKLEKKEEEKTMMRENDDTEKEHLKSKFVNQDLLAKETNLSAERSENNLEQETASEKHVDMGDVDEIMRQKNDETQKEQSQEKRRKQKEECVDIMRKDKDEREKETIKSEIISQGLLTNEANIIVERNENSQEQKRKQEEEDKHVDEIIKRKNQVPEEEPRKSQFVEQALLTQEADLNVERSKGSQKQRTKHEGAENGDEIIRSLDETGDEILTRDNNENDEEPSKSEFIDQGLLTNEADLNFQSESSQEQTRNPEEEAVHEIMRTAFDETREEPIQSVVNESGLLCKEAELNVETSKNNQVQIRESEEKEEVVDGILTREYDDAEEELIKNEFVKQGSVAKQTDLTVERNENQEQRWKLEEEVLEEIPRREYDETEEEPIKSDFIIQSSLVMEADLNVDKNENPEQRRKLEEEVDKEGLEQISREEYEESEEEPIVSEFIKQDSLDEEADLNVERNENHEQKRKLENEEEELGEISRKEFDESEEEPSTNEFIEQGQLAEETDLNVERNENQEQRQKLEKEEGVEEKGIEEISRKEFDESEEEPSTDDFIKQGPLAEETDVNVERNENQEQRLKLEKNEEEDSIEKISMREQYESKEEPIKSEFIQQGSLAKKTELNVKTNDHQEQRRKSEEKEKDLEEISSREFDENEEEPIKSEIIKQCLLAEEADLNIERNENQEQIMKLEEESTEEIPRREIEESEEEPIKSEFIRQGSLAERVELNVERNENQEQRRKLGEEEESIEEILRREYDESKEGPIKSEFIKQGLLAEGADLNIERNEVLEQKRKLEEEGLEEMPRREYDEREAEPIKSEFIKQNVLAEEADLNAERNENQEQRRKLEEEEEGLEEISRREYDEGEEEPIKNEFIKQDSLDMEAELNLERNENQEQRRKFEEDEQSIEKISMKEHDESEEEPIKLEFIKHGSLAEEADLNIERNEILEQRRKLEEDKESIKEISRREYDEDKEEPIKCEFIKQGSLAEEAHLNVERNENQEQRRKSEREEESTEEISTKEYDEHEEHEHEDPIQSDFTDQGFDAEEQAGVCEMENKAVTQLVSVEKITECIYGQDIKELNEITEHEHEASKSQMMDESMFIQLASTQDVRSLLNDSSLLHEKEVIEDHNEETNQETVGKDGHHEAFSACEHVTDTGIVEEQKVCGTELKQFEVIDSGVETESELLEMAQIEMAETLKKGSDPSRMFEAEDNSLAATAESQVVEQSNALKAESEMVQNVDLGELGDNARDQNRSEIQQPATVTQENIKGVITRPETDTGNQTETVKTTPKFRAEAAAVDVKKSTETETSSYELPIEREEVAVHEITDQCFLEQGSLLEEPDDTRRNELRLCEVPLSGVKSVSLEKVDEPEVLIESIYELQSSSFQEEFSSETELKMKALSSSPGQTAEEFETVSEGALMSRGELKYEQAQPNYTFSLIEKPIFGDNPLEDKINQDRNTAQDSAAEVSSLKQEIEYSEALGLPERESEQETLEMPKNSQKDTEEQELIDKAEPGLLDGIKGVTPSFGVVGEIISDLTKKSDERRNDRESELENLKEVSERNMNVELLTDTKECEIESVAEMTDIESIGSVSMMASGGKTEEPKEEKDKCQLVFSETTASTEISRELEHGEAVMDSTEDKEERDRPGLKRGFEKVAGDNDKDQPSGLTDLLFPLEASSLDFTVQKSKIAVKNPLVRPPKDPRMLINMPSVEPLAPPQPTQPSFLKKSPLGGAPTPNKGVIGFKLPGLGAGFPALRKTEAGKKIRDGEDTENVTSQTSDSSSQSADDNVKQETSPPKTKPKWTPPRQPGMGSPMMMAELKSKLRKPAKE